MNNVPYNLFDGSEIENCAFLDFCLNNKVHVLAGLPCVMAELAGRCGFEVMFHLVARYGGKKIYLPKSAADFELATGIVIPDTDYTRWRYTSTLNGQIEIPSRWGIFLSLRRTAIYLSIKEGASGEELLMHYGITQRQIRNLRLRMA